MTVSAAVTIANEEDHDEIPFAVADSLLAAWEAADPTQKSALVTQITHVLPTITRDEAQALPFRDEPVPSAHERLFSVMHKSKQNWLSPSSRKSRSLGRPGSGAVGAADAAATSNSNKV